MKEEIDLDNSLIKLAYDFILSTNRHLFLTGKAGTGKTTFLRALKTVMPKRMIVVAPTGVAALNAGGVTIHSFFQLSFAPKIPRRYLAAGSVEENPEEMQEKRMFRFSRQKIDIIKALDLLIIDEISMVRADLLDGIDDVLRRFRRADQPFGGVQLLMIGDLFQLAPVVTDEDRQILDNFYDSHFFFGSRALQATDYACIDLQKVYRQQDEAFLSLLNRVRENQLDHASSAALTSRYRPDFSPPDREGYITLTTHNYQANRLNEQKLNALPGAAFGYQAVIEGDFPEYMFPTDALVQLKIGAQVMFCKNDMGREKRYYNGKIGTISALRKDMVEVRCPGEEDPITVGFENWDNIKYEIDEQSQEISEKIIGSFSQVPFKLAWAITIHKSQGLTFERAIIDAGSAFAFGQVYVALSRCKTLDGLVLRSLITPRCLRGDDSLQEFAAAQDRHAVDREALRNSQIAYQWKLLQDLFDLTAVRSRLYYLKKIVDGHGESLADRVGPALEDILLQMNRDLFHPAVAEVNSIRARWGESCDIETEAEAGRQIASSAEKFSALLDRIVCQPLDRIDFSSQNKAVRKSIGAALEACRQQVSTHLAIFRAAVSGFSVLRHLQARASVDRAREQDVAKSSMPVKTAPQHEPDEQIVAALKHWRKQKVDRQGGPAYLVLTDGTIQSLASICPRTLAEMAAVKGIGPHKIARYGDELLAILLNRTEEERSAAVISSRS